MIHLILEIYIYGVDICKEDKSDALKFITKAVMESEVCKLPCNINVVDLVHLPGKSFSCIYRIMFLMHQQRKYKMKNFNHNSSNSGAGRPG